MSWRLGTELYMSLGNRKAVGEFLQLEQAFSRTSMLEVMWGWITRKTVFHRFNAVKSGVMPVND
jgi:hypothetical protein